MYYPRSFLKFILLGFLLVSLPLVYALAELILSLDRLASQSREEVLQASQAARSSRLLFEQATTLERLARQEMILEDPALLEDYGRMRQELPQTTRQLSLLPLEPDQLAALEQLREREDRCTSSCARRSARRRSSTELADGYATLVEGAQAMLNATTQLTQRAIERLQETAAQGREKWLWLALATVGIALALAIVFAVLIARPIRQLDQAIRQMGTADFSQAMHVNGPQDLRYLGQRLEWLRARLDELEQQQTRFLRHVSHELKTPLTAVREGAELLRDNVGGRLSPRAARHRAHRSREHAVAAEADRGPAHIPPDARVRAGDARPGRRWPTSCAACCARKARRARAHDHVRDRLVPAVVVGDARQDPHDRRQPDVERDQVFAALGRDRARRLARTTAYAVLDVSDHGPGIAPDERERVFDSFYPGKAPADGRVKGSGLGLAIAREYALAQAGRIEVLDRARRRARRALSPVAAARRWVPGAATRCDPARARRSTAASTK